MEEYAKNKFQDLVGIDPKRAMEPDKILSDKEKSELRKIAGKVGWLGRGCRPDLVFSQIEMSTKFLNGKVKDLKEAYKAVGRAMNGRNFIKFVDLGPVENWIVELSTDASLSNLNEGVNSTAAFIVLIKNKEGLCAPVSWSANKLRRIVDNTLAAEALSLVDGIKEGSYIRELIEEVFGLQECSVPLVAIVDNKVQLMQYTQPRLLQTRSLDVISVVSSRCWAQEI